MKIKNSVKIPLLLSFTLLGLVSLNSCKSSKIYTRTGTVQNIEFGKDGYTANLKDKKGEDFDAIISRVRMEQGYKTLKVGEQAELSGDTIHLDNKVRILVKQIK